jgi:hypothetical protein
VIVFAERLFGGWRARFVPGFFAADRYSRVTVAWLQSTSVAIVLGSILFDVGQMPVFDDYLRSH